MTIASWLLAVAAGQAPLVRAALAERPGVECRSESRGTLVVLTETKGDERSLEALRASFLATPGVSAVSLVTAYREDGPELPTALPA
jgi:nitrate reductase NapAB chaperone NapD